MLIFPKFGLPFLIIPIILKIISFNLIGLPLPILTIFPTMFLFLIDNKIAFIASSICKKSLCWVHVEQLNWLFDKHSSITNGINLLGSVFSKNLKKISILQQEIFLPYIFLTRN